MAYEILLGCYERIRGVIRYGCVWLNPKMKLYDFSFPPCSLQNDSGGMETIHQDIQDIFKMMVYLPSR